MHVQLQVSNSQPSASVVFVVASCSPRFRNPRDIKKQVFSVALRARSYSSMPPFSPISFVMNTYKKTGGMGDYG